MDFVTERYRNRPVQHVRLLFASNASLGTTAAFLAAPATGYANLIVGYRYSASAAASIGFLNGSGGTNFWNAHTLINTEQWGPWWGPESQSPATAIHVVGADGIGSGFIEAWYITVRKGAGAGATTL